MLYYPFHIDLVVNRPTTCFSKIPVPGGMKSGRLN